MKRLLIVMSLTITIVTAQSGYGTVMSGSERVMEMIQTLRIIRMRERLSLNDQQVAALIPLLGRRDSLITAYQKLQAEDLKMLQTEITRRNPNQPKLNQIIDRMRQRERNHQQQLIKLREEIMSQLSVEQQAKFIVFEVEFEREIKRLIDQVKGGYGMRGQPENNQPRRIQ